MQGVFLYCSLLLEEKYSTDPSTNLELPYLRKHEVVQDECQTGSMEQQYCDQFSRATFLICKGNVLVNTDMFALHPFMFVTLERMGNPEKTRFGI